MILPCKPLARVNVPEEIARFQSAADGPSETSGLPFFEFPPLVTNTTAVSHLGILNRAEPPSDTLFSGTRPHCTHSLPRGSRRSSIGGPNAVPQHTRGEPPGVFTTWLFGTTLTDQAQTQAPPTLVVHTCPLRPSLTWKLVRVKFLVR
jgi:hypothetical protein